jgi:predicted ATP-grasp superfamily ATP-dependent carboligase
VTADLFADEDLRRICPATAIDDYPEGLVDWLANANVDGWIYTGALENHAELIDRLSELRPLWGNSGDVLRQVRSPRLVQEALAVAGLLFPETRNSPDGLPRDGRWLAKTYRGSSGSGVFAFDENSSLAGCDDHTVFQRRIDGVPIAGVFVAAGGEAQLLGVTRQLVGVPWTGGGSFQYAGSVGPWPLDDTALETIRAIGRALAARFELVGLFGVDMMAAGDGIWTIEVNPRYTASVETVERMAGIDAVAHHVHACLQGEILPLETSPQPGLVGKAILFARQRVCVTAEFSAWAGGSPDVADVPAAGTVIEPRRPVVTVFATAQSAAEVETLLATRCAEVERVLDFDAPCVA